MRLPFPRGRDHSPGTPTPAHYTPWLLGRDNCLYSEGCKPHPWSSDAKREDIWERGWISSGERVLVSVQPDR